MKSFILMLAVLAIFSIEAKAQEIQATVTVNMEQIDPERRMHVSSMDRDVQNYINRQRYTNIDWDGPRIPVDITIYLSGGNRNMFSGRLFVASSRHLLGDEEAASLAFRIIDDKWAFQYSQGANLSFSTMRFDDFTSLIDFYMLLIIGIDLDTYGELDGTPVYDLARQILLLGANRNKDGWSTYASPGEYTKYTLLSELTDLRFHPFRKLIFAYYVDGLDLMATDRADALDNIFDIIDEMAEFKEKRMVGPSSLLQAFFDANAHKLASLFEGYKDKSIYNKLIYLDPTNSLVYQNASRK